MSEWRETTLGEICNFRRGHDLPKTKMEKGNYPVAGSNGIIGYHNEFTTLSPCITIGRSGNIGNPYIYKQNTWAHNTTLYIDNYKGTDPVFLYYYLQTLDLCHFGGGSAVPTLNRNHIHPISVSIPVEVIEQKAIADTLSCLDEKIESNNKINQTLEDMAQAIFKSWFADFEPFGGEMPEDWEVGTLSDVATVKGGKRLPKGHALTQVETPHPYIRVRDLNKGLFVAKQENFEFLEVETQNVISNYTVDENNIIISIVGTIGLVNLAHTTLNKANLTENCVKIIPDKEELTYWLTMFLRSAEGQEQINKGTVGAVQQKLPIKNIQSIPILLPEGAILEKFHTVTSSLFLNIAKNIEETQTLTQIRNTLLPKLMSGEVRVPVGEVE